MVDPSSIPFGVCTLIAYDANNVPRGICAATLIGDRRIITAAHCKRENTTPVITCGGESRNLRALPLSIYEDSVELEVTHPFSRESEIILPPSISSFVSQLTSQTECYVFGRGGDQAPEASSKMEGARISVPMATREVGSPSMTSRPTVRIPLGSSIRTGVNSNPGSSYNPADVDSNFIRRNYISLPSSEVKLFQGDSGGGLICKDARGKLNLVGVNSSISTHGQSYVQAISGLIDQINRRPNCP